MTLIFCIKCEQPDYKIQNTGERLFNTYCKNCHSEVSPKFLPKEIWEHTILPRMGAKLGIYEENLSRSSMIENNLGGQLVNDAKIYPKSPLIDFKEWERLKEYILELAPEQLTPTKEKLTLINDSLPIKIKESNYTFSPPSTTLIKFDNHKNLYIGDANTGSLNLFKDNKLIAQANVGESPVDVISTPNSTLVLTMGSFSPTDNPSGKLITLPTTANGKAQIILDKLHRPVDMDLGDIDNDGDQDIVIAEFGKWLGQLSILINENGKLKKKVLDRSTGCMKSILHDINDDNQLDIIALFGQGDERITVYINQGNNVFDRKDLIKFHPSIGSSSMQLFDWNKDGKMDIIYTAGDNADYEPILKPYHGIYIFEKKDTLSFLQKKFIPMHGAYNAVPFDFDLDGDFDIAAISFFPDFDKEKSGFALYLNNGENDFLKYEVLNNSYGRWITMDCSDIDSDGDIDLVLGSLSMEIPNDMNLYLNKWINKGIGYITLENSTISK